MSHTCNKHLIINADDFGYCPERNRGIIAAFKSGSVTSSTLLVNAIYAKEAVLLAREHSLPLGLHFNITEGKPISEVSAVGTLVNGDGLFLGKFGLRDVLEKNLCNMSHIRLELEAQIKAFIELTGIKPTHVDGHQHIHVHKNVYEVFAETLKSFSIGFTRLPHEELSENVPLDKLNFFKTVLSDSDEAVNGFNSLNIRYPNGFVGLTTMGSMMNYDSLRLALDKAFSKSNTVELMVHPGYPSRNNTGGCCDKNGPDEFSRSNERLHELQELANPLLKAYYEEKNIKLISFAHLSA